VRRAAALLLALGCVLACGKYGPPVRAGEAAEEPRQKGIALPFPQGGSKEEPEAAPAPFPAPVTPAPPATPEEEPPPEGSP
jgi:hypothetical protein